MKGPRIPPEEVLAPLMLTARDDNALAQVIANSVAQAKDYAIAGEPYLNGPNINVRRENTKAPAREFFRGARFALWCTWIAADRSLMMEFALREIDQERELLALEQHEGAA